MYLSFRKKKYKVNFFIIVNETLDYVIFYHIGFIFQLTDKAGFIMREYVKCSLYDRISTRPFLSTVEKKWIAFQVIYALHQCHKLGVSCNNI
jgi:hypothetical protein